MDTKELLEIISGGEDSFTEYKRDVNQRSEFAAEMIAFANAEGGQILVGVGDDGSITGVNDPKQTEEAIMNMARNNVNPALIPVIERVSTGRGIVLVAQIHRRDGLPHENNSGQCYLAAFRARTGF